MEFLLNQNVQLLIVAYLAGGIPFGLILGKIFAKIDVTKSGSGSIGATNVLRVLKQSDPVLAKKLSIATLALDALKVMLVILIADMLGVAKETLWGMAVVGVLGHCYSPFLKFEGGKGVATGMGVMFYLIPIETAIALGAWFVMAKTLKISSISSLGGLFALIASSYIIHPQMPHINSHAPIWIVAFIIFYKHIPNILRFIKGEEKAVV